LHKLSYYQALKNLVNFFIAILILKRRERKKYFWHIRLYTLKNGKNATETQKKKKIGAVYRDGNVIEHIQSGM